MNKIFIISIFLFSTLLLSAQSNIEGKWLLVKAEMNGQIEEPYSQMVFTTGGKLLIMDMEMATWVYNEAKKEIKFKSKRTPLFDGTLNTTSSDDDHLRIQKEGVTLDLIRLNLDDIQEVNQNSGLTGTWQVVNNWGSNYFIELSDPQELTQLELGDGMRTTYRGEWYYLPQEEAVVFSSMGKISGKYNLTQQTTTEVTISSESETYLFTKQSSAGNQFEELTYTEDDFYDENGNFKYGEDNERLPWNNPSDFITSLEKIKQLAYEHSVLVDEVNVFVTQTLKSNVQTDVQDLSTEVDYIFYGYDSYNLPDDTELPNSLYKLEQYLENEFYPLEASSFRVVGKENIKTPAGSFSCTVIEAINRSPMKLWQIDKLPGVYAKIIIDGREDFGKYEIYLLTDIIKK